MTHHRDEEIKREVRLMLAKDPTITIERLRFALHKRGIQNANGNPLGWRYIAKLVNKVHGAALHDVDEKKIEERMAETRERFAVHFARLARIAHWQWDDLRDGIPMPSALDQVAAMKAIMELDLKLLSAEMDAGLFKRNLGELELVRRNAPMTPEHRVAILAAMEAHGYAAALPAPAKVITQHATPAATEPVAA